ncbi:hypothetical protein LTR62_007000 [Meristemomyces frigidus]|uniref:Uncharacterized protein n=1 Tax=Meristemomyces frigidus TaxID=1508187 RepID=A0AAN7YI67_9PEZI|nr:hypothetical protein LTR62_007000 [Meristemomyces frigidus]
MSTRKPNLTGFDPKKFAAAAGQPANDPWARAVSTMPTLRLKHSPLRTPPPSDNDQPARIRSGFSIPFRPSKQLRRQREAGFPGNKTNKTLTPLNDLDHYTLRRLLRWAEDIRYLVLKWMAETSQAKHDAWLDAHPKDRELVSGEGWYQAVGYWEVRSRPIRPLESRVAGGNKKAKAERPSKKRYDGKMACEPVEW